MADFTKEQELAIRTLDRNVSVSAGAGSGKTRVLVERFLHILESSETSASRILAITFTRKAAHEMKERVRKGILERIGSCPPEKRERWQEELREADRASITTIDSFCGSILRENPVEAGMDPGFEVQEEYETVQFRLDTIGSFLDKAVRSGDEAAALLLAMYSPEQLAEILYDKVEQLPELLAEGDLAAPYLARLAGRKELEEACRESLEALLENRGLATKSNRPYLDDMQANRETILRAIADGEYDAVKPFLNLRAVGRDIAPFIKDWKESAAAWGALQADEAAVPVARAWQHLFEKLQKELMASALKQERFSFSFLAGRALQLLKEHPAICRKYQERFDAVMVDEFQDTNLQQKELVYLLCGGDADRLKGKKLFVVGDAKQSIYRFRGADVSVFRQVRDDIAASGGINIIMADNFRSAPEIIDACNTLFRDLLGTDPRADVMAQDLVPHHAKTARPLAGLIAASDLSPTAAALVQARWTVQKIRELVSAHEGLTYGDVAILVPAIALAEPYAAALSEAGIAYTISDGKGFYERQEIVDFINLLEFLVNTRQDWALAAFLRSPYGGLSDKELTRLRFAWNDCTLWEALGQAIEEPYLSLYRTLSRLHALARTASLPELFAAIVRELHMEPLLSAQLHGREKLANMRKLRSMAVSFAMDQGGSTDDFLCRLRLLRALGARESAANLDSDARSVRIMTIHKSKGLEFPAVFLPDLQYRGSGGGSGLRFLPGKGLGVKVPGRDDTPVETGLYREIADYEKERGQEEKQRQLYVAMTRAESYLTVSALVGPQKESAAGRETWDRSLQRVFGRGTEELIEWEDVDGSEYLAKADAGESGLPVLTVPDKVYEQVAPVPFVRDWQLSASTLLTHDFCPRRYYYAYEQHMPGEDPDLVGAGKSRVAPAVLGVFIHKSLELSREYPTDQAVELALEAGDYSTSLRRVLKEEGLPMLLSYLASPLFQDLRPLPQEAELAFDMPLFKAGGRDVRFEGSIDKLVSLPDGSLKIIDYKTGLPPQSGEAKKGYMRQLVIYARAAEKLYGKPVSSAELHFLRNLSVWPLRDREREEQDMQALLDHLAASREEADYPVRTETCERCPFAYFCPKV